MQKLKIDSNDSIRMYNVFWSFCLTKGIQHFKARYPYSKYKVYFYLASLLAKKNAASCSDWVRAQFKVLPADYFHIYPSFLCFRQAENRYRFYKKFKPSGSTRSEKEVYYAKYVKLVAKARSMTFEDALRLCLKMHFLPRTVYTKLLRRNSSKSL